MVLDALFNDRSERWRRRGRIDMNHSSTYPNSSKSLPKDSIPFEQQADNKRAEREARHNMLRTQAREQELPFTNTKTSNDTLDKVVDTLAKGLSKTVKSVARFAVKHPKISVGITAGVGTYILLASQNSPLITSLYGSNPNHLYGALISSGLGLGMTNAADYLFTKNGRNSFRKGIALLVSAAILCGAPTAIDKGMRAYYDNIGALVQQANVEAASEKYTSKTGVSEEQPNALSGVRTTYELSQAYPQQILQWSNLITKYAKENIIDPNLVAAVMSQESGGQPSVVSACGAVGLMQIMPKDGEVKECGGYQLDWSAFKNRPTTAELMNPETNIKLGTEILRSYINKNLVNDTNGQIDWYSSIKNGLDAYFGSADYGYADTILDIYMSH